MLCIPAFFAVVITAVSDFDRGNANSVSFNCQNLSLPFLKKVGARAQPPCKLLILIPSFCVPLSERVGGEEETILSPLTENTNSRVYNSVFYILSPFILFINFTLFFFFQNREL